MVPALEEHPVKKVEVRHTQTRQTQHSIEAGEQTCRSPSWGHTQLWTVPVASSPFPILCRMTSSLEKLL